MHKDIKPDNIFLSYEDEEILSDFGISLLFEGDDDEVPSKNVTVGSALYFAPE